MTDREHELLDLAAEINDAMHDLAELCGALRYDADKAAHLPGVVAEVARATEIRAEKMMSVLLGESQNLVGDVDGSV